MKQKSTKPRILLFHKQVLRDCAVRSIMLVIVTSLNNYSCSICPDDEVNQCMTISASQVQKIAFINLVFDLIDFRSKLESVFGFRNSRVLED